MQHTDPYKLYLLTYLWTHSCLRTHALRIKQVRAVSTWDDQLKKLALPLAFSWLQSMLTPLLRDLPTLDTALALIAGFSV